MTNYFELYDLPVSFHPDAAVLKSRFYELSRRYHPDRFTQGSGPEMTEALRMAAMNNDAYKTLKSPERTMAYILKMNGLLADEEKYNLPPDFLMEMMDLNEALSDYEMDETNDGARQQAQQAIDEQRKEWEHAIAPLEQQFAEGGQTEALLMQIKDMYFRKKYLLRIKERMAKFAAR